jgi:hypothetical protein
MNKENDVRTVVSLTRGLSLKYGQLIMASLRTTPLVQVTGYLYPLGMS